jgi:hypothetical protein
MVEMRFWRTQKLDISIRDRITTPWVKIGFQFDSDIMKLPFLSVFTFCQVLNGDSKCTVLKIQPGS